MNVGYIIVRENLDDALVQSQCIDVVEDINQSWEMGAVRIIWFYRIDQIFRIKGVLERSREKLTKIGIKAHFVPFISFGFPVQWWLLPLVLIQWMAGIIYIHLKERINFFHCRSYHAGLLALVLKKFINIKYIFDPRSPFPEENVAGGRWKKQSRTYRIWKKIESSIINSAESIIVISPFLKNNYRNVSAEKRLIVCPNNYPASFDKRKLPMSSNLKFANYLVYAGSFGHWNSPNEYLRLLRMLNEIGNDRFKMLFLVREKAKKLVEMEAAKQSIDHLSFDTLSVPQNEVIDVLSQCKCAVYLMEERDPRLGVKTVEYLRAGLPIIVSNNILGSAAVVYDEGLGIVWDHSTDRIRWIAKWLGDISDDNCDIRNQCESYAIRNFSPRAASSILTQAYEQSFH